MDRTLYKKAAAAGDWIRFNKSGVFALVLDVDNRSPMMWVQNMGINPIKRWVYHSNLGQYTILSSHKID
jgi:hypothetical protein